MSLRPFRFGVIVESHVDREHWFALAKRAERLGYDTFLVRDHLAPDYFGPQFAPLVSLAALAGVTDRIRLGTLVIDNDFRHPTMLAKEIATLDVLTGGRVELGIGAGWLKSEYDHAGLPYDPNAVRIDRLEEALHVLRQCFATSTSTFTGSHYRTEGHDHYPPPIQRGGPPILIGAGKPRMLRLAGRYADTVALLTSSVSSGVIEDDPSTRRTAAVRAQIDLIRDGAGVRFPQVEICMMPTVWMAPDTEAGLEQAIAANGWSGVSTGEVADMPGILAGTPDDIVAQIRARRQELGVSYLVVRDAQMEEFAPIVGCLSGQ